MPIPIPRSFNQIMDDLLNTFVSKFGIPSVKVGSPLLAILEASAFSDLRNSQDVFDLLNSISLDRAIGVALDRIGADENISRKQQISSTGSITISDSSFTKKSSKIYAGTPAPIIGSISINVVDASTFSSSGSIYIGRGTSNFEGPLAYTSTVNNGSFWTINLSASTQKFHNTGEEVVLAQGGNRLVSSGTIVQTPQGNVSDAIQFSLLFNVTVPDGETTVTDIKVLARKPGTIGNVPSGAISEFVNAPFTGAKVTNPLPFTTGENTEDDNSYRERIRLIRQSRTKGTALAVKIAVLGLSSDLDSKRITSANILQGTTLPAILIIDDGTGYETKTSGVASETLINLAIGGENSFQLINRPVTKAFITTINNAPFNLVEGAQLNVKVGGVLSIHTFDADSFKNIGNATAAEIVSSINSDATLLFNARSSNNNKSVSIFSKSNTNEDIEVIKAPTTATDANKFLNFPLERNDTLKLYLNDRLLIKDGQVARITSVIQSNWGILSGSQTLTIAIDNTPAVTYTFTDSDFSTNTEFSTLSNSNSLVSWAKVFNVKVPGITASTEGGSLILTSNLGKNNNASIIISSGDLVGKIFTSTSGLSSSGKLSEYTLDRNRSQLTLTNSLLKDDKLTAGSEFTRAFIESKEISTVDISKPAELWFVIDNNATIVKTSLSSVIPLTLSTTVQSWGNRVKITATNNVFLNNIAIGDWAIFWEPNVNTTTGFLAENKGAWRVAKVDTSGFFFEIERPTVWNDSPVIGLNQSSILLPNVGLTFVRTSQTLQRVTIPTKTGYTATSLSTIFNSSLKGATAKVHKTNKLRIFTNNFSSSGFMTLVVADLEAQKLGFTVGNAIQNSLSHLPSIISSNEEDGTPEFPISSSTLPEVGATGATEFNFTVTDATRLSNVTTLTMETPLGTPTLIVGDIVSFIVNENAAAGTTTFNNGDFTVTAVSLNDPSSSFSKVSYSDTGTDGSQANLGRAFFRRKFKTDIDFGVKSNQHIVFSRNLPDSTSLSRYGSNKKYHSPINDIDTGTLFRLRNSVLQEIIEADKFYIANPYALGPNNNLVVVLDKDELSKKFNINLFRKGKPSSTTYGTSNAIKDTDNSNNSLALAFGTGFIWNDFAIYMKARAKSHPGSPDTNKTGLWRYYRHGLEGNLVRLRYDYQTAPSKSVDVLTKIIPNPTGSGITTTPFVDVNILLPSGSARTGQTIRNSSKVGIAIITNGGATGGFTYFYIFGFPITSASRTSNVTTLTLDVPNDIVNNHNLQINDTIFVNSTNINFSSGLKTITARTNTTISYSETAPDQVATPSIGTVSFDTGEVSFIASNIVVGDIASVAASGSSFPVWARNKIIKITRIKDVDGNQYFAGNSELNTGADTTTPPGGSDTLTWYFINNVNNIQFYPIGSNNQLGQIVSAVNGLVNAPITGVAVGNGAGDTTGLIASSTYDELGIGNYYLFSDGINFVKSHNTPPDTSTDFTFTFKDAIGNANLATNSDWINEDVRLVPLTTKNVIDYLNNSAVSGLFANASIESSLNGNKVQITSNTLGSSGAVQVQSGSANNVSAAIIGTAVDTPSSVGNFTIGSTKTLDIAGLSGNMWAALQNNATLPRTGVIDGSTDLDSITSDGYFYFTSGSTKPWSWATSTPGEIRDTIWQIEKQGNFTVFIDSGLTAPSFTGVQEGDWVVVRINKIQDTSPTVGVSVLDIQNTGIFRIVRIRNPNTFWIENANSVEQVSRSDVSFIKFESTQPKDILSISTDIWNVNNKGNWTIETVGSVKSISNAGSMSRVGSIVTVITTKPHNLAVGDKFTLLPGETDFPASVSGTNTPTVKFVASVTNTTTFTYTESGAAVSSTKQQTITGVEFQSTKVFKVKVESITPTVISGALTGGSTDTSTLGSSSTLVQITEGSPSRLIKKVKAIAPNTSDTTLSDIKFETKAGSQKISSAAQTTINVLDKLSFSTDIITGVDSYHVDVGLIQEANKVLYGLESDSTTFPGVVSLGANINIEGPLIKRIQISIQVRTKTGFSATDIANRVKSQIASVINKTPIGQSIALSDIVSAASLVNGVLAIAIISPVFTTGSDLIKVQPNEKPLVINIDQDVLVSFVGS